MPVASIAKLIWSEIKREGSRANGTRDETNNASSDTAGMLRLSAI